MKRRLSHVERELARYAPFLLPLILVIYVAGVLLAMMYLRI